MNKEKLIIVSNETRKHIKSLEVVTPSIYLSVFTKFAKNHNLNIDEEEKITDEFLSDKISLYTDLQDKTSNNANKLSKTTDKAIDAIKNKDEEILNDVLVESKSLKNEIEKLKESVYKDELTKTYNRKWLNDTYVDKETSCFKEEGLLLIIDLNYFKEINDTYGHIIGDKVLIYIANELKRLKGDVIRYGGDEFLIIFSQKKDFDDIFRKMTIFRNNIIKRHLKIKDTSFGVSFSFGITEFYKGNKISKIINKADKEMYEDKIQIKRTLKSSL